MHPVDSQMAMPLISKAAPFSSVAGSMTKEKGLLVRNGINLKSGVGEWEHLYQQVCTLVSKTSNSGYQEMVITACSLMKGTECYLWVQ